MERLLREAAASSAGWGQESWGDEQGLSWGILYQSHSSGKITVEFTDVGVIPTEERPESTKDVT